MKVHSIALRCNRVNGIIEQWYDGFMCLGDIYYGLFCYININ